MTDPASPNPRTRDLLLALEVAGLVVVGVLAVAWATNLVPALWQTIAFEPVVIIGLVAVTILILARALWPRRRS
jgi:hypothetical protein